MDGSGPSRPVTPQMSEAALRRRRRIRNWALLGALIAVSTFFYAIAMVRMAAEHQLPYFR